MPLHIELQAISSGYDRKTCWVHPRGGAIPGNPPLVVITLQKLRLSGSDIFYALHDLRSDDGGRTWVGPTPHPDTLGRRAEPDGTEVAACDFWPGWHAPTGVLLGTGHTALYKDDELVKGLRHTVYSVYSPATRTWAPWSKLEMPDPERFSGGAGCTQRVDLPNGDILLPAYFGRNCATAANVFDILAVSVILRCRFDGRTLTGVEMGNELALPTGRGCCEPSLARFHDRFFLTIRNNERGYVTTSDDGLHFGPLRPWTFDDGSELGSYNTQQHWLNMPDALYLVYTRRGANNDHVFRHRAPLFIARVDTDRLCVLRSTEQIVVPQRGARLGNFGVTRISDTESWVTVAEWMQTIGPNHFDSTRCEQWGSDNSVFVAKVRAT